MKKIYLLFVICLSPGLSWAAGGGNYDHAAVDFSNKSSLQRGAKYFVNYCMGCHALGYQRYNRLAQDLELPERLVEENLIFTANDKGVPTKIGERMTIAMDESYARKAFSDIVPPDLSLTARARGVDWIYTYLRSFYLDENRPMGVNNVVFPSANMPHVLWELQGWQKPIYRTETDAHGKTHEVLDRLELQTPGLLSVEEYDAVVLDITSFLAYAAEPAQLIRHRVGIWVILFLLIFTGVAYLLKKEYWKDVE